MATYRIKNRGWFGGVCVGSSLQLADRDCTTVTRYLRYISWNGSPCWPSSGLKILGRRLRVAGKASRLPSFSVLRERNTSWSRLVGQDIISLPLPLSKIFCAKLTKGHKSAFIVNVDHHLMHTPTYCTLNYHQKKVLTTQSKRDVRCVFYLGINQTYSRT